jgi:hypothetical protein
MSWQLLGVFERFRGQSLTACCPNPFSLSLKRLKGLDGLAMLLVDVDYDGEIFDMDRTVFAKDISDDGVIKVTGLKESIALIAIDKHGNESKPVIV